MNNIITNSQGLKTKILTKGTNSWTITRFSDDLFIGKNSYGRTKTFRSSFEINNFEDFLMDKGFTHFEKGRSLSSLKKTQDS